VTQKRKFVVLAWDCQNCGSENPGPQKTCANCGSPQPEGVRFHQPKGGVKKVTDPKQIEEAMRGPDVHCPFCGTRNVDGALKCTQCGGELKGGKRRKTGDRLDTTDDEGMDNGEYTKSEDLETGEIKNESVPVYPSLGRHQKNIPETQRNPIETVRTVMQSKTAQVGGIIAIAGLFIWLIWMLFFNTMTVPVTLTNFHWELNIPVEEYRWVDESGWSIPAGGIETSSEERITGYEQRQQCDLVPKREYVGSEPCNGRYEDRGNGYAEWVEDSCPVYEDKMVNECKMVDDYSRPIKQTYYYYRIQRWVVARNVPASGDDNNPVWPPVLLSHGEREGFRTQIFTVYYVDEKGEDHSLTSMDWDWFVNLYSGQVCQAKRNGFGGLNPGIDCSVQ